MVVDFKRGGIDLALATTEDIDVEFWPEAAQVGNVGSQSMPKGNDLVLERMNAGGGSVVAPHVVGPRPCAGGGNIAFTMGVSGLKSDRVGESGVIEVVTKDAQGGAKRDEGRFVVRDRFGFSFESFAHPGSKQGFFNHTAIGALMEGWGS